MIVLILATVITHQLPMDTPAPAPAGPSYPPWEGQTASEEPRAQATGKICFLH